jgi:GT2 family glycosyltransferase
VPRDVTRVDVVIPTRNASTYLDACLRSLAASTYDDFTLTVFDDASSEDIRSVVIRHFPTANVVRSDRNRGLAFGVNLAAGVGSAEFVALLNNDTVVDPAWLGELVGCADRHPEAGSVASKIRVHDRSGRLHSAGDFFSSRGSAGNRGVWTLDAGQFDTEQDVFGACGAAALYRREALEVVAHTEGEYFDSRLFMYYEDVELAWRLQRAGYTCCFAPKAIVEHHISATAGGPLASYLVARNSLVVARSAVPGALLDHQYSRTAAHLLGVAFRAARHIREPAARATLCGLLAGLRMSMNRSAQSSVAPQELERIRRLLRHPEQSRFHGVPAARLSRPLDVDGPEHG